jgi:hypothetical protein
MRTQTSSSAAAQLKRQIAYYAGMALRAASRERIRLAHAAIAAREQRIEELSRRETGRKEAR